MSPSLTVVIPAHNPRLDYLGRVLAALRQQTLPLGGWELVIVDNASTVAMEGQVDLSWHPAGRVIREERVGLTAARLAGFAAARGGVIVLVDDDNVLASGYLATVLELARQHPSLGTWSGVVELEFDPGATPPPAAWWGYLAHRVPAAPLISRDINHHDSTPWGAGMCIRREIAASYAEAVAGDPARLGLDLQGRQLVYGGDTDIAYHGCKLGWDKGVFPALHITHLIPASRCERAYLLRAAEGHAYSEILHHRLLTGRVPTEPAGFLFNLKRQVRLLLADADTRALARAQAAGRQRALQELTSAR